MSPVGAGASVLSMLQVWTEGITLPQKWLSQLSHKHDMNWERPCQVLQTADTAAHRHDPACTSTGWVCYWNSQAVCKAGFTDTLNATFLTISLVLRRTSSLVMLFTKAGSKLEEVITNVGMTSIYLGESLLEAQIGSRTETALALPTASSCIFMEKVLEKGIVKVVLLLCSRWNERNMSARQKEEPLRLETPKAITRVHTSTNISLSVKLHDLTSWHPNRTLLAAFNLNHLRHVPRGLPKGQGFISASQVAAQTLPSLARWCKGKMFSPNLARKRSKLSGHMKPVLLLISKGTRNGHKYLGGCVMRKGCFIAPNPLKYTFQLLGDCSGIITSASKITPFPCKWDQIKEAQSCCFQFRTPIKAKEC